MEALALLFYALLKGAIIGSIASFVLAFFLLWLMRNHCDVQNQDPVT